MQKEQKEEAKELTLAEAKYSLKVTKSGRVHVKDQDTPQKKRIALELNRLAGARKRIIQLQQGIVLLSSLSISLFPFLVFIFAVLRFSKYFFFTFPSLYFLFFLLY